MCAAKVTQCSTLGTACKLQLFFNALPLQRRMHGQMYSLLEQPNGRGNDCVSPLWLGIHSTFFAVGAKDGGLAELVIASCGGYG